MGVCSLILVWQAIGDVHLEMDHDSRNKDFVIQWNRLGAMRETGLDGE